MSGDLVPSTGGSVVPATTGGAVGDYVGDVSRDGGGAGGAQIVSQQQAQAIANLCREILRDFVIDGISERAIERCLPIVEDYAPALLAAIKRNDRQQQTRLVDGLRDEIVRRDLLSLGEIERIRKVLHRRGEESTCAMLGPDAHNSSLIDEMRELDSLMANRNTEYWRGPYADRLQKRWRDLWDRGVRSEGKRSTADHDIDRRIKEIEGMMGTRAYTEEIRQELRDLYGRRDRVRHTPRR